MAQSFTLTGNVSDLIGEAFQQQQVAVYVEASTEAITDTSTNETRLGVTKATVAQGGAWSVTLFDTSSPDLIPAPIGDATVLYRVVVKYVNVMTSTRRSLTSGWFPLTANTEFADIDARELTLVSNDFADSLLGDVAGAADRAETAAAAAEAVGTTNDGVIAGRINDPASATASALSASIDGAVTPAVAAGVSAGIGGARVLFEGTSIMHGREEYTATSQQRWDSPPLYAQLNSDGRWKHVGNKAVDGSTSAAILARVDAAIATQPNIIVSDTGLTNDSAITLAQYAANVTAWVAAVRAAGILPVLCTPCPNVDSRARLARGRTWLIRYCSAEGIPLVDWHGALSNAETGGFTVPTIASDGVHPDTKGKQLLGIAIDEVLRQVIRPAPPSLVDIVNDPGDLLGGHGLFIAAHAGGGTLPFSFDGWSNNVGYDAGITWTTPAADKGYSIRADVDAASAQPAQIYKDLTTGFGAGDHLELSGRYKTPDGGQAPQVGVIYFDASYNVLLAALAIRGNVGSVEPIDGVFSQESVTPAGTTTVRVQLFFTNTSDDTVSSFAQVGLRNLTADGVL